MGRQKRSLVQQPGSVYKEIPTLPEAISRDQATTEIIDGQERSMAILPTVDFACESYRTIGEGPTASDGNMRWIAANYKPVALPEE
jgi:hypothetical protein